MKTNVFLVTFWVFFASFSFAQSGRISGQITDVNREEIPFANIILFQNGIQKLVVQSDFDGSYVMFPIDPGEYRIAVSSVGFLQKEVEGVIVRPNRTTRLNITLTTSAELNEVQVYAEPLIEMDKTTTGMEMTVEQIQDAPTRSVSGLVSTGGSVTQSDDGGQLNIAGSRGGDTQIIVNGVKINASTLPNLPANKISEIQVITGGLPAQYGDKYSMEYNNSIVGNGRAQSRKRRKKVQPVISQPEPVSTLR